MHPAQIDSSGSSLVATRPNCNISHSSSHSSVKGTYFPLLSSHYRMMCPELQFTAFLMSAGNGPVSLWNQTPPPLRTAGCCSNPSSQCPPEMSGPSFCPACPSAQGTEPPACFLLLRFATSWSSLNSSLRYHTKDRQYLTQLKFCSCRK